MFKKIFTALVLIINSLFAEETYYTHEGDFSLSNQPLFVSLGPICEMALRLRDCGVRHAAFPFDWTITKDHDRFISLFVDDFQFFTNEDYFCQNEEYPTWVKNTYYKIEFIHDWPFPDPESTYSRYVEQLQQIKVKYDRRIARFRELKKYPGKVFFFRTFWFEEGTYVTAKQAQEIREALNQYFPTLDFTLIIVNYTDSNSPKIEGLEGVLEFKIRREQNLQDFQVMINQLLCL